MPWGRSLFLVTRYIVSVISGGGGERSGSSSTEYPAPCFVNGGTALSSRHVESLTGGCALPRHAALSSPAVRD